MKMLICHGDSLTEGPDLDRPFTWPSLVASRLNMKVVNKGIGGDTTGGLLGRFYPEVVQQQPDLVLIMGGTNDLWWGLDARLIRANIFSMTCQAAHHDILPLVGLPPPIAVKKARLQDFAAPEIGYAQFEKHLAALVKALALAAGHNDVACLDFYQPFVDDAGQPLEEYFLDDGLHPNQAGHRIIADIAIEMIGSL